MCCCSFISARPRDTPRGGVRPERRDNVLVQALDDGVDFVELHAGIGLNAKLYSNSSGRWMLPTIIPITLV